MLLIDPITCLAAAIYFESRGEIQKNQLRVAQTVLNRVESERYPDSICEVVKQKHQFSLYCDCKPEVIDDSTAWRISKNVASQSLESPVDMPEICHYARKDIKRKWTESMEREVHGSHAFYKGGC